MIRFIDLRGQIDDVEDCPVEFAFYTTVTGRFIELDGSQTWTSRAEFLQDITEDRHLAGSCLRFVKLMPEWVK